MTAQVPESTASSAQDGTEEVINTGGAGNTDLHGQAQQIVEAAEDSPTGPTPGGG